METDNLNPKAFLRVIRIIYFAIMTGLLMFLFVALFISGNTLLLSFNTKDPFTFAVLITVVIIPAGTMFSNKLFKRYKPGSTLKEKLPAYQVGLISRLAVYEGAGLLSVVFLLISSNLYFVIFAAIALFAIVLNYPSPERIGDALDLTSSEIETLSK
jgi:hypothetical protein